MIRIVPAVVLSLVVPMAVAGQDKNRPGFLRRDGAELLLDGRPLRLVSVNKFDLFLRFLDGGERRDQAIVAIEEAGRRGFVAIRFAGVGFYPKNMRNWPNEKAYWGAFDRLVKTAKANGVRLIPTINWNIYLFGDMANECVQDMLLDPDSRARQYLWLHTHQIVTRYKDEPTILFWELTNEMNLAADLAFQSPFGRSHLNPVHEGTSFMRLRRDHFTTEQMIPFLKEWAEFVRSLDKNHLIATGFSAPRPAAQHLRLARGKGDWTQDTEAQMATYLRDTHPDPIDLISIHLYPGHDNLRFGNTDKRSAAALEVFQRASRRIGKPLYIGETGYDLPLRPDAPFLRKLLDEVVRLEIPLTLLWNWMSPGRERNISPQQTPRVIAHMEQANRRMALRTDRSALWHRTGKNVLWGFRNMYAPKVVRVPDKAYPLRMWFFGWAVADGNPGYPGCDAIFHARGKDLERWEVYCGDGAWDATMTPAKWKPVVTARDKHYDQWHNGDPSVVYRDGAFYMAYSSTGFNADGIGEHRPGDKDGDILCVMGATSQDGIEWRRSPEPLLINKDEIGAPHGKNSEFLHGMYHRPSLLWDNGRWRLWFDYWAGPEGGGIAMGHAECRGDFLDPGAWTIVRAGDRPLLPSWPNPEVVKVAGKYYSFADPPILPEPHPWKARQIAEAVSDDGIHWTVLGHVKPDADTPALHVPTPFVDASTDPPRIVLFYACQIGGEPYDYRYNRIRYMARAIRPTRGG